ncbi:hypothetical protein BD309DRAFT_355704 [Dichomitus squalens]|nr:hypothetical protein BD309DRAFT_355704 [Dichomitus squalens]
MSTAQLVQTVATLYASSDCAVAALTILVYDCVLSFAEELSCIWHPKRRISAASLIYTVSRYATIISYAVSAATINPMTPLRYELAALVLWLSYVHVVLTVVRRLCGCRM